jgi:hypothetical protein
MSLALGDRFAARANLGGIGVAGDITILWIGATDLEPVTNLKTVGRAS